MPPVEGLKRQGGRHCRLSAVLPDRYACLRRAKQMMTSRTCAIVRMPAQEDVHALALHHACSAQMHGRQHEYTANGAQTACTVKLWGVSRP